MPILSSLVHLDELPFLDGVSSSSSFAGTSTRTNVKTSFITPFPETSTKPAGFLKPIPFFLRQKAMQVQSKLEPVNDNGVTCLAGNLF